MRRILITAGAAAATLFAPLALHTPLAQVAAAATTRSARVVVKFRADSTLLRKQVLSVSARQTSQAQALGSRIGIDLVAGRALSDRSHVVFARGMSSQALAARIGAERDVEYAVVDERKHVLEVPNDPLYVTSAVGPTSGGPATGQWYLKPPGPPGNGNVAGTTVASINAEQAWEITTGNPSIVVAVIDTGLRFDHPDLVGANVLPGYDMVGPDDSTGAGTDFASANDGNGRDPDASDPGDGIVQADLSNPDFSGCTVGNSIWHGTRTLGMIGGATDNKVGWPASHATCA